MDIRILHHLDGAKDARGIAVVIDVFRAFSTACYIAANGAEKIIPIDDIEIAYSLKQKHPEYVLIGERGGVMQEGFDFGNSPAAVENVDFSGKTVLFTTSAGTQGLVEARKHSLLVLTGSFVNAAATALWIKEKNPEVVSLVCMGWNGKEPADEDTLYAEYLADLLRGKIPDFTMIEHFLRHESTTHSFLDNRESCPAMEEDLDRCLSLDRFPFALRAEGTCPLELVVS